MIEQRERERGEFTKMEKKKSLLLKNRSWKKQGC